MEAISRMLLDFLLNSAWQVALVAAAAVAADRLAWNAPARYRHCLWVMALVLSVLLPIGTAVQAVSVRGTAPLSSRSSGAPVSANLTDAALQGVVRSNDLSLRSVRVSAARSSAFRLRKYFYQRVRRVAVPPILAFGIVGWYLLFVLYRLVCLAGAWKRTTDIRKSANAGQIPDWMETIVARCQTAMGLTLSKPIPELATAMFGLNTPGDALAATSTVSLLWSPNVAGPITLGWRRPLIVVPESFVEQVPTEDVTAALAHELAHIRRHDFALNVLYEIIYWPISFHPAARMIKRRIDETREIACDELAAGTAVDAATYARSLVRIARTLSGPPPFCQPGYTLGIFDANILEERVMKLLDRRPRLSARVAAMSLLAASLLLATTCLAASAFAFSVGQENKTEAENGEKLFVGTWQGKFQGEPFVNLVLRLEDGKMTGTLSRFTIKMDGSGNLVEAERGEEGGWHVVEAKLEESTLTLRCQDEQSGDVNQFELRPTRGNDDAEFRPLDAAFPVKPWKMTRTGPTGSMAVRAGGPVEGVVGGVINGVPGGVKGGVIGGVPGDVQRRGEQAQGSISGTVSDPSGARVPGAFVRVADGKAGLSKTIVTDDAGNFLIRSLSPGNYELEVKKPGFKVMHLDVVLGPPLGNAGEFHLRMEPETVLQAVEVTAKAPPGRGETSAKGRPRRIRVGGLIQTTKLLSSKKPEYPEGPRAKGIQGIVLLEAVISKEGEPIDMKVLSSPDAELSKAAMDAVREWRYDPTLLNGEPIEIVTKIAVRFKLEN